MFNYEHTASGKVACCTCKQNTTGTGLIVSQNHQRLWVIRGDQWCQLLHA